MEAWFDYFFGTPARAIRTILVLLVIKVLIDPGIVAAVIDRLYLGFYPVMGKLLMIGIFVYAFKKLLGGGKKKG